MTNLRMIVTTNSTISGVLVDPEFEDRLYDASHKFHLEVSEIISDMLKIMDAKAIDRDVLYSDSKNALITVKFNLE